MARYLAAGQDPVQLEATGFLTALARQDGTVVLMVGDVVGPSGFPPRPRWHSCARSLNDLLLVAEGDLRHCAGPGGQLRGQDASLAGLNAGPGSARSGRGRAALCHLWSSAPAYCRRRREQPLPVVDAWRPAGYRRWSPDRGRPAAARRTAAAVQRRARRTTRPAAARRVCRAGRGSIRRGSEPGNAGRWRCDGPGAGFPADGRVADSCTGRAPTTSPALAAPSGSPSRPPSCICGMLAEVASLTTIRRELRGWFAPLDPLPDDQDGVHMAVVEVVTNVIEHAYPPGRGLVPSLIDFDLPRIPAGWSSSWNRLITDYGTWRPPDPAAADRGNGLMVAEHMVDQLQISHPDSAGTVARLLHRLRHPAMLASATSTGEDSDDGSRDPGSQSRRGARRLTSAEGPGCAGQVDVTTADEFGYAGLRWPLAGAALSRSAVDLSRCRRGSPARASAPSTTSCASWLTMATPLELAGR